MILQAWFALVALKEDLRRYVDVWRLKEENVVLERERYHFARRAEFFELDRDRWREAALARVVPKTLPPIVPSPGRR
jgi:hypothetical protein